MVVVPQRFGDRVNPHLHLHALATDGAFDREGPVGIWSDKPSPASERRRRWAYLIRLVFKVDPLRCEKCGGEMKIISFISTVLSEVIRRILEHLGVSTVVPRAHGPLKWAVKYERDDQASCLEDEAYSYTSPDRDEWEPARGPWPLQHPAARCA